ncbi:BLUF domain-containing protein [Stenotrophomonas maltophilia]|uniref:BLUF domain-containing protein n=1 Tax=Stenotrophomonas maltophilia group TaxID=995085 RepID=UPI0015DDADB5|nr:BLUF domain-containing protein [Stenotrophomonas maltophilia]MBA0434260.1 BLUF domain-containing protein [Stenotrophomonas maltophilia]MDZ5816867.1 BLUF domain-containing protein [Stenotrophomonas maltophilia]
MSLHAIAYASEARADLQTTDLDRLLADATAFNRVAGVTGVLMFDGTRFLQYLEGPEDGIDSVFQRIVNARSHGQVKMLCRAPVLQRAFPRWSMGTRRIEADLLAQIVEAAWPGFLLGSGGFERLLHAWTGADGELEPAAVALGS